MMPGSPKTKPAREASANSRYRNMRHFHWAMFNLLIHAFSQPRLAEH
jgi:hypothetical protein